MGQNKGKMARKVRKWIVAIANALRAVIEFLEFWD